MRKARQTLTYTFFAAGLFIMLVSVSCSTASKNPGDVFTLRSRAESLLESANRNAGRGDFENALFLLDECKQKAILADDSSLIIRICLSRGNVLLALGRTNEAIAEWDFAIGEAQRIRNDELLSVSKIFRARGNLISNGRAVAHTVLNEVDRESKNIRDRLYLAFSWQVQGLAYRDLGNYREAENAVKRSLEIHERDRYLENASYDWYVIAYIRSLNNDPKGAHEALDESINLDRRIENSWGLAASWRAKGDVYRKEGKHIEANEAYNIALRIYIEMKNDNEIAATQQRINGEN